MAIRISVSSIRTLIAATGLLLVVGGGITSTVDAKPVTVHKTISQMTDLQSQNCSDLGGSADIETVKGSVTNGHQVIKTTVTCNGGGLDGSKCTNTRGTTDCGQARLVPTAEPTSRPVINSQIQAVPVKQAAP